MEQPDAAGLYHQPVHTDLNRSRPAKTNRTKIPQPKFKPGD
ncbi:hypothetical protein ACQ4M3_19275 [Leptolyngbya sp. AN03gr2]